MVIRERALITVTGIDGWNEVVAVTEELNRLCASRGWAQGTLFTRTAGRFNELCLEREFPDLATFERQSKELEEEPGIGELFRRLDAVETEDTGYNELWQAATPVPD